MPTSSSPATHNGDTFVCECDAPLRSACRGEGFYKEHSGKRYCVLHYPSTEKKVAFAEALQRKIDDKNFDFRGIWFPDDVDFSRRSFSARANFSFAQFSARAHFYHTQFSADVDFSKAQFNAGANFTGTQFIGTYANFTGTIFSVLASFSTAQFRARADFSDAQFRVVADFSNAQFRGLAMFDGAQFSERADFINTRFSAHASFKAQFNADVFFDGVRFSALAYFIEAQFIADASFIRSEFSDRADFSRSLFSADAKFHNTQFSADAYFYGTLFNGTVYFQRTRFNEKNHSYEERVSSGNRASAVGDENEAKAKQVTVIFDGAFFKEGVRFEENEFADRIFMSFAAAIFEKPERAVFHTTPLRAYWFVNVDSRKFTFINVDWRFLGKLDSVQRECEALEKRYIRHVSRLLEVTFRQLAVNAEENNRYEEAADFRYMAMEVRRQQGGRKVDPLRLNWWYWLLSGYGERVQRAFVALLTIWLLFAVIYWAGDAMWWQPRQSDRLAAESRARAEQSSTDASKQQPGVAAQQSVAATPLTLPESLIYSAGVMSLQKPEPLPANKRAKAFVLFETILGPLQAALLALAIRRKFMR